MVIFWKSWPTYFKNLTKLFLAVLGYFGFMIRNILSEISSSSDSSNHSRAGEESSFKIFEEKDMSLTLTDYDIYSPLDNDNSIARVIDKTYP